MAAPAFRKFLSNVRAKSFIHDGVASVTASTVTLSRKLHSGRTTVLNRAAGITVTLPDATGSGDRYRLVGRATLTGNTTIKVANATDVMVGGIHIGDGGDTAAAVADFFTTAATSDTITMDSGANGGGKIGDWVELEDFMADKWLVHGMWQDALDPATPFSATV